MKRLALLIIALSLAQQAQASTRSFSFPQIDGHRISACLSDGSTCGKPAADVFCKEQGFTESIMFAREEVTEARAIDNAELPITGPQDAFTRIKCYLPKSVTLGTAE